MKKTDLKTAELKKLLGAYKIRQEYHNKNKTGGNFGISIYFGENFDRERDKYIHGNYKKDGDLYGLSFGSVYGVGQKIPDIVLKDIVLLSEYILNLKNGGDWLKFLKDKNLLDDFTEKYSANYNL